MKCKESKSTHGNYTICVIGVADILNPKPLYKCGCESCQLAYGINRSIAALASLAIKVFGYLLIIWLYN